MGDSGAGKKTVAHYIHQHSLRRNGPFIEVSVGSLSQQNSARELFGSEDSDKLHYGRFEQANSGTLFLDEIGDMPAELQTRLLRVLADGVFYRVGGAEPVKVDVRIIAATHQDLERLVAEGRFREDLFHRLNVIRIHLPALRERREDIPLLMDYFLKQAAKELGVESKTLLPKTAEELKQFEWRGNVRQLENTARWLTVMASGQQIHVEDLPPELRESSPTVEAGSDWCGALRNWARQALHQGRSDLLDEATPAFEAIMIETALEFTGGRKQDAARLLGWGRNTLTRKIKELGLEAKASEDVTA